MDTVRREEEEMNRVKRKVKKLRGNLLHSEVANGRDREGKGRKGKAGEGPPARTSGS